jgi:Tfp pilus assembly protein PilW
MQDSFKDQNGNITQVQLDANGNIPVGQSYRNVMTATATQVKSGSGVLHSLTFSQNDAAPTAGTIDVYDSLDATGRKIFSWTLTTAVFNPSTVILDVEFGVGLYVNFTTTADVNVLVAFR